MTFTLLDLPNRSLQSHTQRTLSKKTKNNSQRDHLTTIVRAQVYLITSPKKRMLPSQHGDSLDLRVIFK